MSESTSHESLGSENAPDPDAANAGKRRLGGVPLLIVAIGVVLFVERSGVARGGIWAGGARARGRGEASGCCSHIEQSVAEVKRGTTVIGRVPGEASCLTLVWAVLDLYIPTPSAVARARTDKAVTRRPFRVIWRLAQLQAIRSARVQSSFQRLSAQSHGQAGAMGKRERGGADVAAIEAARVLAPGITIEAEGESSDAAGRRSQPAASMGRVPRVAAVRRGSGA